ncbi:MAG: hypothetical protein OJF50_000752 [Nitrospira sp.]|nr:hypothetical protein [Nitrospira sp.]
MPNHNRRTPTTPIRRHKWKNPQQLRAKSRSEQIPDTSRIPWFYDNRQTATGRP